jgi:hypothetical protein
MFGKSLVLLSGFVISAGALAWNPLETTEDARARHNAERYEIYKNNGYSAPLGGYPDRLGDPAPRGTTSPGMNDSYRTGGSYGGYGSSYGGGLGSGRGW